MYACVCVLCSLFLYPPTFLCRFPPPPPTLHSDDLRQGLRRLMEMSLQIASKEQLRTNLRTDISQIEEDQRRIRENIKSMEKVQSQKLIDRYMEVCTVGSDQPEPNHTFPLSLLASSSITTIIIIPILFIVTHSSAPPPHTHTLSSGHEQGRGPVASLTSAHPRV